MEWLECGLLLPDGQRTEQTPLYEEHECTGVSAATWCESQSCLQVYTDTTAEKSYRVFIFYNLVIERKEARLPFVLQPLFGQQHLSQRFEAKSLPVALVFGISSWKSL